MAVIQKTQFVDQRDSLLDTSLFNLQKLVENSTAYGLNKYDYDCLMKAITEIEKAINVLEYLFICLSCTFKSKVTKPALDHKRAHLAHDLTGPEGWFCITENCYIRIGSDSYVQSHQQGLNYSHQVMRFGLTTLKKLEIKKMNKTRFNELKQLMVKQSYNLFMTCISNSEDREISELNAKECLNCNSNKLYGGNCIPVYEVKLL